MTFILRQAHPRTKRVPLTAIVVFGAAEYAGRPSPVFRARLDHAYNLFQRGLAPLVITTGGYGGDPNFSEGGVGRNYLSHAAFPNRSLIAETQGGDTEESAERVTAILNANRLHEVVAVSDAYHIFRIQRLMRQYGIVACARRGRDRCPTAPGRRSWPRCANRPLSFSGGSIPRGSRAHFFYNDLRMFITSSCDFWKDGSRKWEGRNAFVP